jgi:hypothetical protein
MTHTSLGPHSLTFKLGPGFWNAIPPELISPLTDKFTIQARCALNERDMVEPDGEHLKLIAMAAMESVCLLHNAALNPAQEDFDHHFSDFVVRAVAGYLNY